MAETSNMSDCKITQDLEVHDNISSLYITGRIPHDAERIRISAGHNDENLVLRLAVDFEMNCIDIETKEDGKWKINLKKDNPCTKPGNLMVFLTFDATKKNYQLQVNSLSGIALPLPTRQWDKSHIKVDGELKLTSFTVKTYQLCEDQPAV